MRILAVTNLFPNPYEPGRAAFNRQSLRALARHHEVRVLAPIAWTEELAWRVRVGNRLPSDRRSSCDGIPVEHPRYLFPPKVLRNAYGPCYRWSVRGAFARTVRAFQPHIVYGSWAYPDGWAAVNLGHAAGLPVVVKVHGSDLCMLEECPARRRRTAETLTAADAIVAVSRDLARRAVSLGAASDRVHVVYNGVDSDKFHPGSPADARKRLGLPPDTPIILAVGRLVPVKGLNVLLEAFARMARAGVPFNGMLIGDGPLRESLRLAIEALRLEDRVGLVGAIPHDHLPDWYRAANVVALSSHSEGIPGVLLEAVACGIPFVASNVGGIPEIRHGGLGRLVPPGDPARLAEALTEVLSARKPAATGHVAALRSLEQPAEQVAELFREVIAAFRRSKILALRGANDLQAVA
jgi:glycosyltransferase involved in cell wall biosynthesis